MARILNPGDGRWYDELKAVAYYGETELERWIHQHAKSVFPHHYVIPFKKDVTCKSTPETKRPDLALIRFDFSGWVIVEVELGGHTLDHVLEQTRVFLDGSYNLAEIAQYVRQQFLKFHRKRVSLRRLRDLFDSHPPSVLVIADEHREDWQKELGKLGVQFCIFEIYKDASGHHLYRVFGEYPTVYADEAQCRPHASLPNLIEVIGHFTFTQITEGGVVDVFYDEYLTQWCLINEQGKQYLQFLGISNPLPLAPRDAYGLFRDKSNRYYLKRS
jgi:hypothetical protein